MTTSPENSLPHCVVGLDLGPTKILAGVFRLTTPGCAARSKLSTKPDRGVEAVIERLVRAAHDAVDEADLSFDDVRAVGVGVPGTVDASQERVLSAPLLSWRDVPLKAELEQRLGVPVFLGNETHAAMLGVYAAELKSRPRNVAGIFVGATVGGALVINGELFTGSTHSAADIAHWVLDPAGPKCHCGKIGCLDALASRRAILEQVVQAVAQGEKTVLTEMRAGQLSELRSGDLRKALRKGDPLVERLVRSAAGYLGLAVGNLVNLINPDLVVLGGGLIEALTDEMMPTIIEKARPVIQASPAREVPIVASKLGDDAGITGSALMARTRL